MAILAHSGVGFESFATGTPADWEEYKVWLHREARRILEFRKWRAKDVGTGRILERVVESIEIHKDQLYRNNLVRWEGRWGPKSKTHRAILAARHDVDAARALERTLYALFKDDEDEERLFEDLKDQIGNHYDVIAYLFFLKDQNRFMPVSPQVFSEAFRLLELDDRSARKCTWDSYSAYNDSLRAVQEYLREYDESARLIDAHSFCYMLVKLPAAPDVPDYLIPVLETAVVRAGELLAPREGRPTKPLIITPAEFEERDAARRRIGLRAEQIALDAERQRLVTLNLSPDLAQDVSDDVSRGYDILSLEENGQVRTIEVKAARVVSNHMHFMISPREWEVSQIEDNYFFYLVLDANSKTPRVLVARGRDLTVEWLKPASFNVTLPVELRPTRP